MAEPGSPVSGPSQVIGPRPERARGAVLVLAAALLAACGGGKHEELAQQLMSRHIDARGGRAALEGLQVIERLGLFTYHGMTPEAQGLYHTCVKYPDRVVLEINAGPVQMFHVLGEAGALECEVDFMNCQPAGDDVREGLLHTARSANREELDEKTPEGATLEPIRESETTTGYRYRKGERIVEVEFTPHTGLMRRAKSGSRERIYGDWRDAGGLLLPMRIEDFEDGKRTVTVVLNQAEHRKEPSAWCAERLAAQPAAAP